MEHRVVKEIVSYYQAVPAMVRLLKAERRELEEEYNGLQGMNMDGMPHGTTPGKPVESMVETLDENHTADRLKVVAVKIQILEMDADAIKSCLDALNGRYKTLIIMRYSRGYSWAHISLEMGVPDSTVRNWHDKAMERLGEVLEDVPMVDELAGRASRART